MRKKQFDQETKKRPFAPLGDIVYEILLDEVVKVKILPGERLNEALLAKEFEISRTPIHTAILRLAEQQLVQRDRDGGKYMSVTPITWADCYNLAQARGCIESYAAFLAARCITDENLKRLLYLAKQYEKITKDTALVGHEACDHEFHKTVVYACGNACLIDMYQCIELRILRYRYFLRHILGCDILQPILTSSAKSHWAICHALETGLSAAVQAEMATHVDEMRDVYGRHDLE